MATGLTDEALLSGDLKTVEHLVYHNESSVRVSTIMQQSVKFVLINLYRNISRFFSSTSMLA